MDAPGSAAHVCTDLENRLAATAALPSLASHIQAPSPAFRDAYVQMLQRHAHVDAALAFARTKPKPKPKPKPKSTLTPKPKPNPKPNSKPNSAAEAKLGALLPTTAAKVPQPPPRARHPKTAAPGAGPTRRALRAPSRHACKPGSGSGPLPRPPRKRKRKLHITLDESTYHEPAIPLHIALGPCADAHTSPQLQELQQQQLKQQEQQPRYRWLQEWDQNDQEGLWQRQWRRSQGQEQSQDSKPSAQPRIYHVAVHAPTEKRAHEQTRLRLKAGPQTRSQARRGKALITSELLPGADAASDADLSSNVGVCAAAAIDSIDPRADRVVEEPTGMLELESPLSVTDHMRLLGAHTPTPTPGQLSSCNSLMCQSLMSGLVSGSVSFGSQDECNSLGSALPSGSLSFELTDGISSGFSSSTPFNAAADTPRENR
eukprot:g349.t1